MSDPPSEMSSSTKAMLAKVRKIVPPMLEKFHKGQLGRVAVIGGSADYTGAPYFSAMASARLGCDLSHVICEPSAAPVIKSYSPNLMVHPLLHSAASAPATSSLSPTSLAAPIIELLPRLHVLVIGPGLGRDKLTHKIISEIIAHAREKNIPFVLDADGLFLIQSQPDLVKGYKDCILTPNIVEFGRLAKALGVDVGSEPDSKDGCAKLARALGGVTIIQKGKTDIISNGLDEKGGGSAVCDIPGGLKRSGGQGDTLTGSLGTFLAWRQAYHEGLWDVGEKMNREESLLVAAWAGSAITRECSRRAFKKRGRSLQASDLTEEVEVAFLGLVGEPKGDEAKL